MVQRTNWPPDWERQRRRTNRFEEVFVFLLPALTAAQSEYFAS